MFCNTMGVKETTKGNTMGVTKGKIIIKKKKQNGNEPEVELKEL